MSQTVDFVACLCHGFPAVGDYPDSGNFRLVEKPASQAFSSLAHDRHIADVERRLTDMGLDTNPERIFILEQVTAQSDAEVAQGLAHGPMLADEVDAILGKGEWRPLLGFGVVGVAATKLHESEHQCARYKAVGFAL